MVGHQEAHSEIVDTGLEGVVRRSVRLEEELHAALEMHRLSLDGLSGGGASISRGHCCSTSSSGEDILKLVQ